MTDINPTLLPPTPATLESTLDAHRQVTKKDINCVKVGVIQSFNSGNQTATVKIAYQQVVSVSTTGVQTLQSYPLLINIPVFVLFGGNDFLSMPIAAGDNCIVLFNDRDLQAWFQGSTNTAPITGRLHDISDGIAIVGVNPLTHSIASYLANGVRMSHGTGGNLSKIELLDALINITATNVHINGDLTVTGNMNVQGNSGVDTATIGCNLTQTVGKTFAAGNGATGTFNYVTVVAGIVTGGTP